MPPTHVEGQADDPADEMEQGDPTLCPQMRSEYSRTRSVGDPSCIACSLCFLLLIVGLVVTYLDGGFTHREELPDVLCKSTYLPVTAGHIQTYSAALLTPQVPASDNILARLQDVQAVVTSTDHAVEELRRGLLIKAAGSIKDLKKDPRPATYARAGRILNGTRQGCHAVIEGYESAVTSMKHLSATMDHVDGEIVKAKGTMWKDLLRPVTDWLWPWPPLSGEDAAARQDRYAELDRYADALLKASGTLAADIEAVEMERSNLARLCPQLEHLARQLQRAIYGRQPIGTVDVGGYPGKPEEVDIALRAAVVEQVFLDILAMGFGNGEAAQALKDFYFRS